MLFRLSAVAIIAVCALLAGCGDGPTGPQGPPGPAGPAGPPGSMATVNASAGCAGINAAIAALPAGGGEVLLSSGTFSCTSPVVIDRDNVALRGQGFSTILKLADGANAPVLVLGQTIPVPTITRNNIQVSDLLIDGNRFAQTRECMQTGPCSATNALRNNGISPRRVSDVVIDRVIVHSARSGGLVCELGCRRVTVRNFTSIHNFFDGLAGYETENSTFENLSLHNNCAAGISTDIRFNNNILSNIFITRDAAQMTCNEAGQVLGTVGMFIRDSNDNVFADVQIRDQREHGVFVAQVDTNATTAAKGNIFTDMVISGSQGFGMRINDASCVNNMINNTQFVANVAGCLSAADGSNPQLNGTICR